MKKHVSLALAGLLAATQIASAATLSGVSGSVLINQGKGFVPAQDLIELNVGDQVYVGEGGFAAVAYETCEVALDKPTVHSVAKVAPCEAVITPTADVGGLPPVAGHAPYLPILVIGGAAASFFAIKYLFKNESDGAS